MNAQLSTSIPSPNAEAITAWNTVLFDKWDRFRPVVTDEFSVHSEALFARQPPRPGARVLDIGCGFGDTTRRLATLVGPAGHALGVDAAPRFVDASRTESQGVVNTSFAAMDVQDEALPGLFDDAYSRFGTMFFQNPVRAFANVRRHLRVGGRLAMVVWRRRQDNALLYDAERIVREFLDEPERTDQVTCGPGPFALADADLVTTVVRRAGFENIDVQRHDHAIAIGRDEDEAIDFAMNLGPAGEIVRLSGGEAEARRAEIDAALRAHFRGLPRDARGRIVAGSSVWLVTAFNPEGAAC